MGAVRRWIFWTAANANWIHQPHSDVQSVRLAVHCCSTLVYNSEGKSFWNDFAFVLNLITQKWLPHLEWHRNFHLSFLLHTPIHILFTCWFEIEYIHWDTVHTHTHAQPYTFHDRKKSFVFCTNEWWNKCIQMHLLNGMCTDFYRLAAFWIRIVFYHFKSTSRKTFQNNLWVYKPMHIVMLLISTLRESTSNVKCAQYTPNTRSNLMRSTHPSIRSFIHSALKLFAFESRTFFSFKHIV